MQAISEWLHQLGVLILLAGLSEIILPNSSVRKTTRLFIGLIVILSIIDPLMGIVSNPHWVDGLFQDVLRTDGNSYIEAGAELASRFTDQAEQMWVGQASEQLGVLVTLIDGIVDADVTLRSAAHDDPWTADVTVSAASRILGDDGVRAEKEREVAHLIDKLMQPRGVAHVHLYWEEASSSR